MSGGPGGGGPGGSSNLSVGPAAGCVTSPPPAQIFLVQQTRGKLEQANWEGDEGTAAVTPTGVMKRQSSQKSTGSGGDRERKTHRSDAMHRMPPVR